VGAGHAHALYIHEHSPLHRIAAEAKVVAALGVVTAIAITPRQQVWAFGLYALMVSVLVGVARVPPKFVAVRLLGVAPFVVFALLIPFIATGETTEVWGMELSVEGLWATWNILAKGILGATVTIVLTATTEVPDIIEGMGTLRVPAIFVSITMFMIRYLELVSDELGRMRLAMAARGYDPSGLHQVQPIASSAGTLFVRSYERGERIHAAMLSRGFTGTMPDLGHRRATGVEWLAVGALVSIFISIAVLALVRS
jgi:cobalt/nickel transport system permease protein